MDFAKSSELDIYTGMAGDISWDLGGLYYIYPGSDAEPEENFFKGYADSSYTFATEFEPTASVGVAYSPDFLARTAVPYICTAA